MGTSLYRVFLGKEQARQCPQAEAWPLSFLRTSRVGLALGPWYLALECWGEGREAPVCQPNEGVSSVDRWFVSERLAPGPLFAMLRNWLTLGAGGSPSKVSQGPDVSENKK